MERKTLSKREGTFFWGLSPFARFSCHLLILPGQRWVDSWENRPQNCCLIPTYFMYLLHTLVYSRREIWLERILLKAAGHLRLKYSTEGMAGKRGRGSGLLIRVPSAAKNGFCIFVHNVKMASRGTERFLYLISEADALDILWIFWFSCMKGKEMYVRWQRLFLCKIPLPDVSKYYKQK